MDDLARLTSEDIAKAIKKTEYKYFGDYEMSDDQRQAVDTLVLAANTLLELLAQQQAYELRIAALEAGLRECGDRFAFYAREHTAAGKTEKAEANQRFADLAKPSLRMRPVDKLESLKARLQLDAATDALGQIAQWAEAYPADIFPEPDLDAVNAALRAAGIGNQMDRMHAAWARHLTAGIGEIAHTTLNELKG